MPLLTLSTLAYSRCPRLPIFNNQRLSILCLSEYSCLAFFTPCNTAPQFPFLAVSTPAFWDVLVPLFPFPLFRVSHFQRPQTDTIHPVSARWRNKHYAFRLRYFEHDVIVTLYVQVYIRILKHLAQKTISHLPTFPLHNRSFEPTVSVVS